MNKTDLKRSNFKQRKKTDKIEMINQSLTVMFSAATPIAPVYFFNFLKFFRQLF